LLIKLTSRGPILFGHKRQGLDGREFRCWKFRSMRVGADKLQDALRKLNEVDGPQFKIAADPRITPIGKFLRRSNLDELPQLLNVLRGTMSLVGPRPSPDNENQMCPAWRRARLSVKPGITGLWQVLRLRNDPLADFQEWIYYDVEYARHRSIWLDLQILLYTPVAILAPKRVSHFAEKLSRFGICSHSRQTRANKTLASRD
jgi:lipopolysaccharide/colanic/teichoic acid biosynthesis glycosyltransferase